MLLPAYMRIFEAKLLKVSLFNEVYFPVFLLLTNTIRFPTYATFLLLYSKTSLLSVRTLIMLSSSNYFLICLLCLIV